MNLIDDEKLIRESVAETCRETRDVFIELIKQQQQPIIDVQINPNERVQFKLTDLGMGKPNVIEPLNLIYKPEY